MNELPLTDKSPIDSQLRLSRAVRCALASIVLGFSYPNLQFSLHIENFQRIYHDMLGNRPLPPSTTFVVHYHTLFASFSILLPIIAVATIFWGRVFISVYVSSITLILFFVVFYFEWHALVLPLISIVYGMQGPNQ
jgi:hypothetical protein